MEYDLEIFVPVCKRYEKRLSDFKRYGIINVGENKVFLNLIVSNDEEIDEIDAGWPENVTIKVHSFSSAKYIANIFNLISEISPQDLKSRWVMKLDDDSSTDVGGLIKNLDEFYDHNKDFYLGAECPSDIQWTDEYYVLEKIEMGKYRRIINHLRHEIECCVISASAMRTILSNEMSVDFLKKRSCLDGGLTDIPLGIAAAMAKVYPIECPFLSHRPLLSDFSATSKGRFNHIHMISRDEVGENFERTSVPFFFLRRLIDGSTETEKKLENVKFFAEKDDHVELIQLMEKGVFKVKFDDRNMIWMERENQIIVFGENKVARMFNILPDGNLSEFSDKDAGFKNITFTRVARSML